MPTMLIVDPNQIASDDGCRRNRNQGTEYFSSYALHQRRVRALGWIVYYCWSYSFHCVDSHGSPFNPKKTSLSPIKTETSVNSDHDDLADVAKTGDDTRAGAKVGPPIYCEARECAY